MKLQYFNASEMKSHVEIKHLCDTSTTTGDTTYTTRQYEGRTYYIISSSPIKEDIDQEFLKQYDTKSSVRNIIKNIPEITIEFEEYENERGVFDRYCEVETDDYTIRFALHISDKVTVGSIRVYSGDDYDKLDIQDAELEKIKRKLIKQINY